MSSRRYIILAYPTSITDIRDLYRNIAANQSLDDAFNASEKVSTKEITILGELALSSIKNTPVLLFGPSWNQFLHLTNVKSIQDESDLAIACTFQLTTDQCEYRFSCDTSTDYIGWISAIKYAFDISRKTNVDPPTFGLEGEPFIKRNYIIEQTPVPPPRKNTFRRSGSVSSDPKQRVMMVRYGNRESYESDGHSRENSNINLPEH